MPRGQGRVLPSCDHSAFYCGLCPPLCGVRAAFPEQSPHLLWLLCGTPVHTVDVIKTLSLGSRCQGRSSRFSSGYGFTFVNPTAHDALAQAGPKAVPRAERQRPPRGCFPKRTAMPPGCCPGVNKGREDTGRLFSFSQSRSPAFSCVCYCKLGARKPSCWGGAHRASFAGCEAPAPRLSASACQGRGIGSGWTRGCRKLLCHKKCAFSGLPGLPHGAGVIGAAPSS